MLRNRIAGHLFVVLVFLIFAVTAACKKENNPSRQKSPPGLSSHVIKDKSSPIEGSSQDSISLAQQTDSLPKFTYLRKWEPNNIPSALGADILLEDVLSEQELVRLVKHLAGSHDPVIIRVFTSQIAYDQEQSEKYGPEYDSDYILFYVKNFSSGRAYRGCNEIRWMQEVGKFSSKFGTKTEF